MPSKSNLCTLLITFSSLKGAPWLPLVSFLDPLLLIMYLLHFSGPTCQSQLRLSIQDPSQPRGLRTVKKFCSPLALKSFDQQPHYPLIIKANLVFLDFYTINQTYDMFSGAFAFQNSKILTLLKWVLNSFNTLHQKCNNKRHFIKIKKTKIFLTFWKPLPP